MTSEAAAFKQCDITGSCLYISVAASVDTGSACSSYRCHGLRLRLLADGGGRRGRKEKSGTEPRTSGQRKTTCTSSPPHCLTSFCRGKHVFDQTHDEDEFHCQRPTCCVSLSDMRGKPVKDSVMATVSLVLKEATCTRCNNTQQQTLWKCMEETVYLVLEYNTFLLLNGTFNIF